MTTISDIRRANLHKLLARYKTKQEFADALGKSHSQVSQLLMSMAHSKTGKPRHIGDKVAREIEATLKLPLGWMDQPNGEKAQGALSPDALEVAVKLDQMKASDLIRWTRVMLFVRLAVVANEPTDAAQRRAWAEELANLLRATLAPTEPE